MKALVLVTEAYGGFGGIAVYCEDFLDALANLPYLNSITVLPRIIRNKEYEVPSKIDYRTAAARGKASFGAETLKQSRTDFDVIICTHVNLLLFARLAAGRSRTPIICILYGTEAWVPSGRLFVDRLVKSCDQLISISSFTRDRFIDWSKYPDDRIALLPNCVRQSDFGLGPKPDHLIKRYECKDRRVIMTLGRLDARQRQKGIDELLELMPRLSQEMPDIKYLIAGDGDDRPRLEQKVIDLDIGEHVTFCGRVSEAEKADHYRLCDVYSMAGRQEGFGFVFLEAMATGAPVVASELDGSRDAVLNGKIGAMANPDDPASLAREIKAAFAKPRQIPAKLDYFSFANFAKRTDQIMRPYAQGMSSYASSKIAIKG